MSQRAAIAGVMLAGLVVLAGAAGVSLYRRVVGADRAARATAEDLRREIAALDAERTALRARLDTLAADVAVLRDMPDTPLRLMVPTSLIGTLVDRVVHEVADHVVVRVSDVTVRRTGTVRRRITLGTHDLRVTVDRVTASLRAGAPRLTFGRNRIEAALPLTLASGSGQATVDFHWDGRSVAGAVCGDMAMTETVTGTVVPRTYPVSGALELELTDTGLLLRPRLPRLRLHIDIAPSADAWDAVQRAIDAKRGLCGLVLDRIDVLGAVRQVVARGFDVRVPTERATPFALPVGVEPTIAVGGAPVAVAVRLSELSLTAEALWLGASVDVENLPRVSSPSGSR